MSWCSPLKQKRFYVFNGEHWPEMLRRNYETQSKAANPAVQTWGPDLRPKSV